MKSVKISALSLALLVSQVSAMEVAPVAASEAIQVAKDAAPAAAQVAKEVIAPVAEVAQKAATTVKKAGVGTKVSEFFGSVKSALPSKEQAKAMVKNAPKATYEFVKAHPYKAAGIAAVTAVVAYVVYKVCTAKKATKTAKTK